MLIGIYFKLLFHLSVERSGFSWDGPWPLARWRQNLFQVPAVHICRDGHVSKSAAPLHFP